MKKLSGMLVDLLNRIMLHNTPGQHSTLFLILSDGRQRFSLRYLKTICRKVQQACVEESDPEQGEFAEELYIGTSITGKCLLRASFSEDAWIFINDGSWFLFHKTFADIGKRTVRRV